MQYFDKKEENYVRVCPSAVPLIRSLQIYIYVTPTYKCVCVRKTAIEDWMARSNHNQLTKG